MWKKWKEKIVRSSPAWVVGAVIALRHFIDSLRTQLDAFIVGHLVEILLLVALVCVVLGMAVYEWKMKLEQQLEDLDEKAVSIIERLDDK